MWVINDKIILEFHTRSARLYNRDDHEINVDISLYTGKILTLLLLAKGDVVKYYWLIYLVWGKNNHGGSYNNLTLNILKLRDALEIVGIDRNAVINLPGKGYCCTLSGIRTDVPHVDVKPLPSHSRNSVKQILWVSLFILILSGAILFYKIISVNHPRYIDGASYLFQDKLCDIYTFDHIPDELKNKVISSYRSDIPASLQGCASGEIGFVFISNTFDPVPENSFFYSVCEIQHDKLLACHSYLRELNN